MKKIILIGIGATMTMDLWALLLKALGVKGLNFAFLGRWILSGFKFAKSPAIPGELYVGWFTHYMIGIFFSLVLFFFYGLKWTKNPTLKPALTIGLVTVLAPLLILQPALGVEYSLSTVIKSFVTHTVYGFGLYLSAVGLKKITGFSK